MKDARRFVALAILLPLFVAGCARSTERPKSPGSNELSEAETGATDTHFGAPVQASASVISADEALGLEELLRRGDQQLRERDYSSAAQNYERAVEHAVKKANRLRGLFGWGTALDLGAQPRRALEIYSRYFAEAPHGPRRDEIAVRQVRLLVYLERYQDAARAGRQVEFDARAPLQQLALLSARAHHELQQGRLEDAERTLSQGRALVDAHSLDRVTVPPLDVASLFFALGELRSRRAEQIKFDPIPADFGVELERRCQLILDAQSAYSEAMRSQDAHWSSMSGVKVGQLYKSLHADLMAIPTPEAATNPEKEALFEGAMRLRYSILLTKALSMMKATVALLDRTHQESRWRAKAREALEDIQRAQKAEDATIDALPYSRNQLQQVLDEMIAKAQAASAGDSGS